MAETPTLNIINKYTGEVYSCLIHLPVGGIAQAVALLSQARAVNHHRVYIFGNGGSAATATHFASDLCKQAGMKATSLTTNLSLITAWANDVAYDSIFSEQLRHVIEPRDIAIGISCSGDSPSVLNGIATAKAGKAITIGFVGLPGGHLRTEVVLAVVAPSNVMEQVEDIHLMIAHIITLCLKG